MRKGKKKDLNTSKCKRYRKTNCKQTLRTVCCKQTRTTTTSEYRERERGERDKHHFISNNNCDFNKMQAKPVTAAVATKTKQQHTIVKQIVQLAK